MCDKLLWPVTATVAVPEGSEQRQVSSSGLCGVLQLVCKMDTNGGGGDGYVGYSLIAWRCENAWNRQAALNVRISPG
jgi:hypothetical protein